MRIWSNMEFAGQYDTKAHNYNCGFWCSTSDSPAPPDEPGMLYVKRVVGLPGETIVVKNGKVYADGVELDNSFTKAPQNRRGDGVYKVPEGHYFFLGDNRNNSNDSRFWKQKYVPAANLRAKARLITFPFTRIGWL